MTLAMPGLTSRSSMSRTAWLTWCRISRQHSSARSTFSRSAGSSAGKARGVNPHRVTSWLSGHGQRKAWGGYLCSARCSAAAVGTWSAAAFQWGSCPLTAAVCTEGGSQLPGERTALRWPRAMPFSKTPEFSSSPPSSHAEYPDVCVMRLDPTRGLCPTSPAQRHRTEAPCAA